MQIIKKDNKYQSRPLSIFDEFFRNPFMDDFYPITTFKSLSADIWEDEKNVYIKMAMPGVKSDDIKVEINDDVITLSGSAKSEEKDESKNRYYYKSMASSYEQSFRLPCKVDEDSTDAKYEDGILNVTLPKIKEKEAKVIKVK